ncbi:MAG TPA: CoA transferase, partial [Haliea salexigens]|nr:CoA transferase [Haliea salexigens]
AILRNVRELQHHPQLRANGFFTRLQHAVAGELDYPNFPFQFDGQRFPLRAPAPMLGEHNAQVLGELAGLQPDELEQLQTAGVIGTRPAFVP